MSEFDPRLLAEWCGGRWTQLPQAPLAGFAIDSRKAGSGDLFVAIATERRDGHAYLRAAREAGAAAALVERPSASVGLPQLEVADTRRALRDLAAAYRKTFEARVIGITGSCGKTSTKNLLASVLGDPPAVCVTPGNCNNLLGAPLALLSADARRCRYAVIEAGISEPGEMGELARMIRPDIAVVTAIGAAHLEALGTVDNVAREKGRLVREGGAAKAYLGDSCEPYLERLSAPETTLVRRDPALRGLWSYDATLLPGGRAELVLAGPEGPERYRLATASPGMAGNAALALAAARELGLSPEEARRRAASWQPGEMRGEWVEIGPRRIFLDCYNANPMSMRDALETFAALAGADRPRFYLVGCMEELGDEAARWHLETGRALSLRDGDKAAFVGRRAAELRQGALDAGAPPEALRLLDDIEEVSSDLNAFEGDIFIKGSRSYRLELALENLLSQDAKC